MTPQITSLTNQVRNLSIASTALQGELETTQASKAAVDQEAVALREQVSALGQNLSQTQANLESSMQAAINLHARITSLEQQLTDANTTSIIKTVTINSLMAQLDELQQQYAKEQANVLQQQQIVENLQQDLKNAKAQIEIAQLESARMSAENQGQIEELRRQVLSQQEHEKITTEGAQKLANEITILTKQINNIEDKQNLSALERLDLDNLKGRLAALKQLRKDSFLNRAINAYIHSMKKINACGGENEIKAIVRILKCNIEVWSKNTQNSAYELKLDQSCYLPETALTRDSTIRILLSGTENALTHFDAIAQSFNPSQGALQESEIIRIISDNPESSLFYACIKALPLRSGEDLNADYLPIAAYSLRLEACEYFITTLRAVTFY